MDRPSTTHIASRVYKALGACNDCFLWYQYYHLLLFHYLRCHMRKCLMILFEGVARTELPSNLFQFLEPIYSNLSSGMEFLVIIEW